MHHAFVRTRRTVRLVVGPARIATRRRRWLRRSSADSGSVAVWAARLRVDRRPAGTVAAAPRTVAESERPAGTAAQRRQPARAGALRRRHHDPTTLGAEPRVQD